MARSAQEFHGPAASGIHGLVGIDVEIPSGDVQHLARDLEGLSHGIRSKKKISVLYIYIHIL